MPAGDRVRERRRAPALARHYRDAEGLSIREISRRLGRAEATVNAYPYDPSDDNKRPTDWPQERQFSALAGHARTSDLQAPPRPSLRRHEAGVADCPIRRGAEVS